MLTDDDFEAESAVGSCVHDLYQRLGGVASFEARVRVADEFVSRRALALEVRDPIVQAAAFLAFRNGCFSVSALAVNATHVVQQPVDPSEKTCLLPYCS